jgi:hypothetical protein
MAVNELNFYDLNHASKIVIEKIQMLALEKQKLEEAIRIRKLFEQNNGINNEHLRDLDQSDPATLNSNMLLSDFSDIELD